LADMTRRNQLPVGYTYAGIGDFLLQHASWHEPRPMPDHIHRGVPRACFSNALALSKRHGYRFVEGYAVPDIADLHFPAHHAWVLDSDGNVIDSTWDKTGLAYFGVEFPFRVAHKAIIRDRNTVLDNPVSRFAIFRKPFVT